MKQKIITPVKVNQLLDSVTISDIENHKLISESDRQRDLNKLRSVDAHENQNCFYGNQFLYHYQFQNLLKCQREKGQTIYDIWSDESARSKLIEQTLIKNRGGRTAAGNIFEAFRINTGSIVMFKATTAKYIYQKYSATSVFDPTAGWGGRMLGAWALGIDYTGCDTNINMKPAYDGMIDFLNSENTFGNGLFCQERSSELKMHWQSCLDIDYSSLDYDLVLTSPPYVNLELYEHMTPWRTHQEFYQEFLIPVWQKCITNIRPGGHVCFNISPKMYSDAVRFGLPESDIEEDLLQQLGQQTGKKKQDKIYIWKKSA
jgi:hypothetical protein